MTISLSTGIRAVDDLIGVAICLAVLGVFLVALKWWELTRRNR